MHIAALQVLGKLGLSVENRVALEALRSAGVRVVGTRAYFRAEFMQERLEMLRAQWAEEAGPPKSNERLTFSVSDMCQYYHSRTTMRSRS